VLVDYAHTADALDKMLRAVRELTPGGARLICVFGSAGERDHIKRPSMGRVVGEVADLSIITSDDPHAEDPMAIISMIEEGAREAPASFISIADRRAAIGREFDEASPGDVVVIAGKGHERVQRFADHVVDFDDRVVAREILERRA
jgi:UDP-N-acetylmuramoyl-L-alanyl-D-glutamate--2,6-diaminopimelate ligase